MAEGEELYRSSTVDQLKALMREQRVPLAGNKAELVKKVANVAYTDRLEEEIEATTFECVEYAPPPNFEQLPSDGWTGDDFRLVRERLSQGKGRLHKEFSNWSTLMSV